MPWVDEYYSNRMSKYGDDLLIATSNGIIKYNNQSNKIYNISEELGTDPYKQILMISVTPNNDILYTVAPSVEFQYSDVNKGVYIHNAEGTKPIEARLYGKLSTSLACCYDESYSLWIASTGNIFPSNTEGLEYPFYYSVQDAIYSAVLCSITDIQFDSKGNLWMAIYGYYNHLSCLKKGESLITNISKGKEYEVCSIAIDKNDNIWYAALDGIHCYNQTSMSNTIMNNSTNTDIPDVQFYDNDIDDNGNVWFTSENNLLKWDGTKFTTYTCPGYQDARSILCDGNIVWVLLKSDKLLRFQNKRFKAIDLSPAITSISESITDTPKAKAYVSNGVLYIESTEDITNVKIYDAMGREILTPNPSFGETSAKIALPNVKGVFIVKVNSEAIKVISNK